MKKIVDIVLDKLNNNKLSDEEIFGFLAYYYSDLEKKNSEFLTRHKKDLQIVKRFQNEIENIFENIEEGNLNNISKKAKELSLDVVKNIKDKTLPQIAGEVPAMIIMIFGYIFSFILIFGLIGVLLGESSPSSLGKIICFLLASCYLSFCNHYLCVFVLRNQSLYCWGNFRTSKISNINVSSLTIKTNKMQKSALSLQNSNMNVCQKSNQTSKKDISYYSERIKLNPNEYYNYYKRAQLYALQNEDDKALIDCTKAIELNPSMYSCYAERALLYERQNEYNKAIDDYRKAIELNPNDNTVNAAYYAKRAQLYALQNEDDKALINYNKAIEFNPNKNSYYIERDSLSYKIDKLNSKNNSTEEPHIDNNSIEEQNKIKEELQDALNKFENTQTETNWGINTQNVSKNTNDILQNNKLIISQSISEKIGASYDFSDVIEYFDINIDSLPKHERLLDNKVTNGFIDNVDILKQCNIKKLDDNCRYMLFESFEFSTEKSVYTFVIDKRYLYSEGDPLRYTYTNTGTKTLLLLVVGTGDFFYNRAFKYVEEGFSEKAIKDLKQAIRHVTDSSEKEKLQDMLNKIENGTYINKNETQKQTEVSSLENDIKTHTVAKDIITDNSIQEIKEINIQNCTKEEIQTLEGFSTEKAEKFIQERKNGKMWYDIDSFVQDFELQPHEMVMIQDRIKFPEKPKNKYGRKIDI